jgi:pimeloyl-ACP methyl ester carboxylesterase
MNRTAMATLLSLAGAAIYVEYRARAAERAHPPIGRFIDVDGVRLHYVEAGQGQPLVLLHGLGTSVEELAISGLIAEASKRYRVIAFDRPGYGYSERPRRLGWHPSAQARVLRTALRMLDVHRPVVAGHSWSTLVAIALALESPEEVAGLVLLSGLYFPSPRLDVPLLSPPAIPVVGALLRHTVSPIAGRLMWRLALKAMFAPAPIPERFSAAFPAWMALRPSQLLAVAQESFITIPATVDLARRYKELTLPVVIVAGEKDRYVSKRHSERLHRLLPNSELVVAPGAGHMVHHLDLRRVMNALERAVVAATGPQPSDRLRSDQTTAPASNRGSAVAQDGMF